MTLGRAALLGLVRRYLHGLLDPFVSLLEIHKVMYFLRESGQLLRLKFEAGSFGPYARNLRQVMIRLEGHWLSGYGDGSDNPDTPIELINDAERTAELFLNQAPEVRESMEQVAALIKGYEDSYGLELLSSMHWVMCHEAGAREFSEKAIAAVQNWNPGKQRRLKPEHFFKACRVSRMQSGIRNPAAQVTNDNCSSPISRITETPGSIAARALRSLGRSPPSPDWTRCSPMS